MTDPTTLTVDGLAVPLAGERNLLEVIRKANIELPTFCYHSELSIYGACRLCMVEVEGRGLQAACSTLPEPGMKVRTQTAPIRELRKVNLELLLASGNHDCPTCGKSGTCKLQSLAGRLGVTSVPYHAARVERPLDTSSPSLVRDPNKCVLCGDCVRFCSEIQGIGVLDFTHRGSGVMVTPAFNKGLADVDCVNCGQCAAVCPTGAITVKSETESVHRLLLDPAKTVVVQVAPAVRVALGELFGLQEDGLVMGRTVAALRRLGFDKVYDTAFAADLTIVEEATEFLHRVQAGGPLPLFTSCCPAWIKLAEQDFPELLPHLSTCRSPQQMFGSLAKEVLVKDMGLRREDLVVVAIMPCTAKKFEARRPELAVAGNPDVDFVLTTQELGSMIKDAGLAFGELEPESLDMPFGFKTGAGVIFGNSGGVSEAVLRFVAGHLEDTGEGRRQVEELRGEHGRKELTLKREGGDLRMAVVQGLANARTLVEEMRAGRADYDFIEVMACPGGCIGGAGQPVAPGAALRRTRAAKLRHLDRTMEFHRPQDNHLVDRCYDQHLGEPGGSRAHHLLHTRYQTRRRIQTEGIALGETGAARIPVTVCVGTACYLRGSQELLKQVLNHVEASELAGAVDLRATFCSEACDRGPTVKVNGHVLHHATLEGVTGLLAAAGDGRLPRIQEAPCCAAQ
jgi:NADH-quinone oxidoreductase subunit G